MTWQFGEGQTREQELKEIKDAREAGLEREYLIQQRWARMRAAETERKRTVRAARRRHNRLKGAENRELGLRQ